MRVDGENVEAELDSQLGLEGGGRVGAIRQLTIRADVLHTFLMGRVAAVPGAIPPTAIITGPRTTVVLDAERVYHGRGCRFGFETIGLGDIEPLDFAEIVAPVSKTRFDAVQHGSMKRQHRVIF